MRRVTVSLVSIMVCATAWGDARLPVVNLSSAAVSARAAFGETPVRPAKTAVNETRVAGVKKSDAVHTGEQKAGATRARAVTPRVARAASSASADMGGQIAANNADILMPRRPSNDLWASTDAPLRMPDPAEFSVIRSDAMLPEESLDNTPVLAAADNQPQSKSAPVKKSEPAVSGALDAEIAKLVELQKKADASIELAAARAAARPAAVMDDARPQKKQVAARRAAPAVEQIPDMVQAALAPVTKLADSAPTVRQMVVPMDADVIMRPVAAAPAAADVTLARVADNDLTRLSPAELKKAFKKTYLSENKHLSTFQIDDRFDIASDMETQVEGFTAVRDLSEAGGVRPLEIKIKFRGDDASLSRENYNLLTEYAAIVVSNPKRAIQVSIPQRATVDADDRKLAARRLAIVEQVLRDTGVSEHRIMPVLSQRDDTGLVLRIISSDQFETLTQKKRDMFGDTVGKKTYKSMTW